MDYKYKYKKYKLKYINLKLKGGKLTEKQILKLQSHGHNDIIELLHNAETYISDESLDDIIKPNNYKTKCGNKINYETKSSNIINKDHIDYKLYYDIAKHNKIEIKMNDNIDIDILFDIINIQDDIESKTDTKPVKISDGSTIDHNHPKYKELFILANKFGLTIGINKNDPICPDVLFQLLAENPDYIKYINSSEYNPKLNSETIKSNLENYKVKISDGSQGCCLYWSLATGLYGELRTKQNMDNIKKNIKDEYNKVIDKYNYLLHLDIDIVMERLTDIKNKYDKEILEIICLSIYDYDFMNSGVKPKNINQFITNFDNMYGGASEIKIFIKLFNKKVLLIEAARHITYFFSNDHINYSGLENADKKEIILIRRTGIHYDAILHMNKDGNEFIFEIPSNFTETSKN